LAQEAPDVGLRALTGIEWAEVLRQASDFATSRGGKADDSDERYQLGKMAHALALGCVDPDDPQDGLFFDGGVQQILDSVDLGRDGIAYLYEQLEVWQDETHPQQLTMGPHELDGAIAQLAGDEESSQRFFSNLRRGMQWRCARFMALMLLSFLGSKSGSGTESQATSVPTENLPKRKPARVARKRTGSKPKKTPKLRGRGRR
jgi:hypothetical protein